MTADLVQRIDAALEHPSSLSVSEVAKLLEDARVALGGGGVREVDRVRVGMSMKWAPMLGRDVLDNTTGVDLQLMSDGSIRWRKGARAATGENVLRAKAAASKTGRAL